MNYGFWKDKTVLITGNTGFKGSWLTIWLKILGCRVVGYSLAPPSEPSLFQVSGAGNNTEMIMGDVRDKTLLARTILKYKPDIVIHMAAQSLVRPSYHQPAQTYEINVMGTVNLLEALRVHPCARSVLVVTSDKCYENRESGRPFRENDPMGGYDPYSSSKGCAELVVAAYRQSFFPENEYSEHQVALASARAGNVIGGGDWSKDRLIVDAMNAFISGKKLYIRNPEAVRPWQHVLDPLTGYLILAEKLWTHGPAYSGAWNFGPDLEDSRPVAWVVDKLCRFWGGGANWRHDKTCSPHEAELLFLDSSKARLKLEWHPRLKIMSALAWTAAWYRAFQRGADMNAMCLKQIDQYEELKVIIDLTKHQKKEKPVSSSKHQFLQSSSTSFNIAMPETKIYENHHNQP
ncbi:CDP-glucose 4,6-dehydratase [Desulfonatronovibrio magnus]|uniref:CDP-glucose 4,6-dehydratase n=1 Tax=Desulfonatronovibrio magnus TaxID=698827 RepID=UPI000A712DB3|nr:CDP-glucose 4,6-dehydratase [Desulfonatronovibrio magnus]